MAKVVIAKLNGQRTGNGRAGTKTKTKRIRAEDGTTTTLRVLDTESDSFGDDFTRAFAANVRKARAENKRVSGVADRVPAKG